MGRSPKPLTILVTDPDMLTWPEVEELKAKGHVITGWLDVVQASVKPDEVDIVIGPNSWRMTPALRRYFPQAIAAARKARYPKRGDEVS